MMLMIRRCCSCCCRGRRMGGVRHERITLLASRRRVFFKILFAQKEREIGGQGTRQTDLDRICCFGREEGTRAYLLRLASRAKTELVPKCHREVGRQSVHSEGTVLGTTCRWDWHQKKIQTNEHQGHPRVTSKRPCPKQSTAKLSNLFATTCDTRKYL